MKEDPDTESTDPALPAFIAVPKGAPVYYGFPLIPNSELDGFRFGMITCPDGGEPETWGDAYVIAPNGSRAGIVWSIDGESEEIICEPDEGRWGVYGFRFAEPVRSEAELLKHLHSCLPALKQFYDKAERSCPESTKPVKFDDV